MKKKILLLLIIGISTSIVAAQTTHKRLRTGNAAYAQGHFAKSEEQYRKVANTPLQNPQNTTELERNIKAQFNLANALFQQKRFDEAAKNYTQIIDNRAVSNDLRAQALHNLGNIHIEQKKYDEAVKNYRQSLQSRPNDVSTRQNLANALRKQRQEQQKNQQKNQQNQAEKDKKEDKKQNPNQKDQKDNQEPPPPVSKGQSEQMLQILNEEERKVQQKMMKGKPSATRPKKDW